MILSPAMETPRLEVFKHTDTYALGLFGPVLIQLWQVGTPLDGATFAREAAQRLAASDAPKTASLVIVPRESTVPERDARDQLAQLPDDLARGAGLAMVHEGTGFRASAVRAILLGMMRLARSRVPHEVVATVPEGVSWLCQRVEIPGGARALNVAVRELRGLYR